MVANLMPTTKGRAKAAQTPVSPGSANFIGGLRAAFIGILVGVGSLSLVAYVAVHWVEHQVFTPNNWAETVAPLPQSPVVASALSNYTVNQLYSSVDVPKVIADALPPKAAFLATPLSNQLKTLAVATGEKVVKSDQFNQVWVTANRTVITGLVNVGRSTPAQPPAGTNIKVGQVNLNFNISDLEKLVTERLGTSGSGVFDNLSQKLSSIQIGLKSTATQLRTYFSYIDYANAILPYLTFASLLAAVAIAIRRRRVILAASVTVVVLALMQLIGLHALRPAILDNVQNSSYRPAVGVIYDTIIKSLNSMVVIALIVAVVVYIGVAVLTGSGRIAKIVRSWSIWKKLSKSTVGRYTGIVRSFIDEYRLRLWGIGALLSLVVLAFWVKVNATTITQIILSYIIFIAVVQLLVPRRGAAT